MSLFLTASLAALSTVLYNLSRNEKITPPQANPALALSVTYGVALGTTLALFVFFPVDGFGLDIQKLNWVSFAQRLGLAIAGVEVATLLAYRAGWELRLLAIMVNVVASLVLVILGVIIFKDKLTPINVLGILVCIVGLVMLNYKR